MSVVHPLPPPAETSAEADTRNVGRIARSGAWSILAAGATAAAAFLVSIIVGRSLGPASLGEYSVVVMVLRLVPNVLAVGIPAAITRFVSEKQGAGEDAATRGAFHLGRRIHLIGFPVPAALVALWLWRAKGHGLLAAAVFVGLVIVLLDRDYQALLAGLRRFRSLSIAAAAGAAVQIAAAVCGFVLGLPWQGFVLLFVAATVVGHLLLLAVSRPSLARMPAPELGAEDRSRFLRFAGIMILTITANEIVWGRIELLFLDWLGSGEEVGLYAAGLRLAGLSVLVPLVAARALMPEFSWLRANGRHEELARAYPRVCVLLAAVSAPLAVGGAAVAGPLVVTFYGPAFGGAATAAMILIAGTFVNALTGPASAAVLTGPRPRLAAEVGVAAVVVNVALDVLLIPPFGPVGAAIGTVSAQALGVAVGIVYAWRRLGLRYPVGPVLRLFSAAVVAALAAAGVEGLMAGPVGLLAAAATGAAVYVLLLPLTRTLRLRELRSLFGGGAPA